MVTNWIFNEELEEKLANLRPNSFDLSNRCVKIS